MILSIRNSLTLKTSKSLAIGHVISFLYSFLEIIGNQVYIKKYKDAKDPKIGLYA